MAVEDATSTPDFSETVDISFDNVDYIITITTTNSEALTVEVEQKNDASRWVGEFSGKYIEDITSKTGNFKKFPVFVKMLVSAVKQQSDSVFVDLLTYQDLEMLKSKKNKGAALQQARPMQPNNKRYLILTYAAEFDRVHYPLPLMYETNPDPEHMKRIIRELRAQLDFQKSLNQHHAADGYDVQYRQAKDSNQHLLKEAEFESAELLQQLRMVSKERDLLHSRLEALDAELERERGLHRRELARKAKELQQADQELQRSRDAIRELRMKCKELAQELEQARRRPSYSSSRPPGGTYSGSKYPSRPSPGNSRGNSRPNSRGVSPGGSRNTSPYSRPWAQPPSLPRSSPTVPRPNSAPRPSSAPRSSPRFDPTEYVKQKREREQRSIEQRRASSRSSSVERYRPSDFSGRGSGSNSRVPSTGRITPGRSTPGTASPSTSRQPSGTWGKIGPPARQGSGRPSRSSSPSTALQDVKDKLKEFVSRNVAAKVAGELSRGAAARDTAAGPVAAVSTAVVAASEGEPSRGAAFDDASADIADIDARLKALQSFLKMAKTSAVAG